MKVKERMKEKEKEKEKEGKESEKGRKVPWCWVMKGTTKL